jgi:hypothetical protein
MKSLPLVLEKEFSAGHESPEEVFHEGAFVFFGGFGEER